MSPPRFSIGIDLGTTNSAMAFVPLAGDGADAGAARSEVFSVPQWDTLTTLVERPTLPSFLYLPEAAVAGQIRGRAGGAGEWIVGLLARRRAGEVPGRVAHSAKSWLCHHAADREAPFLPWGSEDVPPAEKVSPVRAQALILNYLRSAWNDRFAASGPDFAFDAQEITVTVPASFDAAAQRLTLTAAREAGFPATARLLEEPQAAFYCWLEQHAETELFGTGADEGTRSRHVLVVDVGGGTSDFSLFAVRAAGTAGPRIKRLAVSDHILLGGDNIDLAIAHRVEPRLAGGEAGNAAEGSGRTKLSGSAWDHLVARCRDIKEDALVRDGAPDEAFSVSIPGRGSGLIASALTAQVTRAEIERILLDGFFAECKADARVRRARAALKEWGLPYAADSAITRHLAEFLRGRPVADAVLFNGGSLYPERLRTRICEQIGAWQGTAAPSALANPEPDLAVARGAACFGALLRHDAERIEAGAARAIFLEAHARTADGEGAAASLVCILPRDAAPEQAFEIATPGLELRVDRPVRFQAFSSTRHAECKAGDVIPAAADDLHALPPLQTVAKIDKPGRNDSRRTVPVTLSAKLSELGLLQVACRSADPAIRQTWPLDFNLRPHERTSGPAGAGEAAGAVVPSEPNAAPAALQAARARIAEFFAQPASARARLTGARLFDGLEKALALSKGEWNWVLVRSLWPALEACAALRRHSVEHEECWLILAGFLLRPGFGAAADEARIDALWSIREGGLRFPNKRVKLQEYILLRRVAGGLSRERQEAVLAAESGRLERQKNPPPELVRMVGALERLGHETKEALIRSFIEAAASLAREHRHCAPYLAALGLLLNRAPLYAGPDAVVAPKLVEMAWDAFSGLDWADPELAELQTLFLRAARVLDNRSLDVPSGLRSRIAGRLEKVGVAPQRTARIREHMPMAATERLGLFGESLPPGLVLSES